MPPLPDAVVERAPAKINLDLHVLGRRADGYHELDSLVAFAADAGDEVRVEPAARFGFSVAGPFAGAFGSVGATTDNLVARAAVAVAAMADRDPAVAVRLEKRLPVAAGLGGGSADAAATVRGLLRLWGLDPPQDRLEALALRLGADVPACLLSRPLWMRGIGERLAPLPGVAALDLVLACPNLPLPTARVFAERREHECGPRPALPRGDDPLGALPSCRNDLEPAACRLAPAVAELLDLLRALPGCRLARMSGSGPTCFGHFGSPEVAKAAAASLQRLRPAWWVAATRTVPSVA